MKAPTVLLLLVASSCCIAFPVPSKLQRRAEIPDETLDLVYDSFVTVFRTVQATYPPELLQEIAKELLVTGGRFQFSDELSAQLDEKNVEVRANLKYALEEIAITAAGLDGADELVISKVHDYLDYAVDVLVSAVPMDTVEALVVAVLENEGSFDFSPELQELLGEALALAKVDLRKVIDYEFELFEDLIELDDETRALIYQYIDYLADETYQAIPWKLLEDIVYDVIEKEGVIDLSDELNERIEETLESLRQKLREVLESLETLFPPKRAHRVVSSVLRKVQRRAEIPDETLDLVYDSFVTVFRTVQATYPPELLQEIAKELLATGGRFQFSDELSAQLDEKNVEVRANLKFSLEEIAITAAGLDGADELVISKVHDYLDYAVDVLVSAVPMDTVEALVVAVLENEGSFDFSPELQELLGEALALAKVDLRKVIDYEFELFEDLIELDDETRALIYQYIDYLADETYQAIPWKLLEDIVYDVIEKEGVIDLSDELNERIEETLESLRQKLREVLESLETLFPPKRAHRVVSSVLRKVQRRAEIPDETLDLVYDSFVTVFRTVQATYPPELLQEIAKELLVTGGRFQFSDELSAQLDEKNVEVRANLKFSLEEIAITAAGLDGADELVISKVHDYLDYAVDVLVSAVPMDTVEALVVAVLENEGSFDFSPELQELLGEALALAKVDLRKVIDYEFELFEDLIALDDETRALIYQIIDYLADETYQAIPWKLLEDIVYDVIEKEGVIDLSDELNERIEETLESLRQKLREVLESLETLFPPKRAPRVVSEETMQLVYESIMTMFNSLMDNFPDDVFQDIVHAALVNGGEFAFSDELSERLDVALETVRLAMEKNLLDLALQGFEGADDDIVARLADYFEHATQVMFEVFPADVLEEIVKEALANGGVFEFSDSLLAMIDADLVRIKESSRELFDYEFAVLPELQELTDVEMELIYQASDYVVDEVYKIIPWTLFEEIVYTIVINDGVVTFSDDLIERIDSSVEEFFAQLKDIMDKATDLWE